jgi:hypothetical protein
MSASITIKVYTNHEILSMTPAEFREFLRGSTDFYEVKLTQASVGVILSDMYVTIRRRPTGDYKCYISGGGFDAQPVATRETIWATLTDGYGLWALHR